jgi:ABC-2 type transport system permease protein
VRASASLWLAIAQRSFRRYSTYRAATLAGIFTNCVFGAIISFTYIAVWKQNPDAGGYDVADAVTYAWLGQAMLMTVVVWSGGATDDLAARIKSGDVAIDLYRPVSLLGWYLASDLGRALYHLLTRGLAPTIIGGILFDLRYPDTALSTAQFAASVVLAVTVSFGIRMMVSASAFWLFDDTGVKHLAAVGAMFFSGLAVPLVLFPGWTGDLAAALPWASYLQVPADLWLGKRTGAAAWSALGFQLGWTVVLLLACQGVLSLASRKVVVQGG